MFDKLFKRLKPAVFNYKEGTGISELDTERKFIGVMAQDIRQGLADEGLDADDFSIVHLNPNGFYSVDYVQLIPILINRIKKMEDEIRILKGE